MINKLDELFKFHQQALQVREQRQQLLASNIANADTPNYKARDIDFRSALMNALGSGANPSAAQHSALVTTAAGHLRGTPAQAGTDDGLLLYRKLAQGSVDGNTVDMDAERAQFMDNTIRYEASLTLLNSQIKSMLAAIQG